MRDLIKIVEDSLGAPTEEWREKMLAYARTPDTGWTALHTEETGLPFTVYASEEADYPAIIVDSMPGHQFYPSPGSKAYRIGEKTGDALFDQWVANNLEALRAYCAGQIDTPTFDDQMLPVSLRSSAVPVKLNEMANIRRGLYNVPLAFFVRPEGKGTSHQARVKVNTNYNLNFDKNNNFSIIFFPSTKVADGHNTGQAKKSDVDGMIKWLDNHKSIFIAYYSNLITKTQFKAYLDAHPYP